MTPSKGLSPLIISCIHRWVQVIMVFETLTVECRIPEISKYWDGFHQVHLQFMQNDANNILDIIIVYFDISIDLNCIFMPNPNKYGKNQSHQRDSNN